MQVVAYAVCRLVKRHRGTMPVILTAAHGGSQEPAGVDAREKDQTPSGCDFEASRDNETAGITTSVAQKILDLTGLSPYVVIADYHRKYIDANRTEECAFTDMDAQPLYQEYHDRIAGYVGQILSQNQGRGFLFDIHGTRVIETDPADIYLGTADGASLPAGFDRRNIFMQHGLHGLLKSVRFQTEAGSDTLFKYDVSPADENTPETSAVSGGFTIRNYGLSINSIQVEIADTIRANPLMREFFVDHLAIAIVNSVRRHEPF